MCSQFRLWGAWFSCLGASITYCSCYYTCRWSHVTQAARSQELRINAGNRCSDWLRQAAGGLSPLFPLSLECRGRYGERCKTATESLNRPCYYKRYETVGCSAHAHLTRSLLVHKKLTQVWRKYIFLSVLRWGSLIQDAESSKLPHLY